MRKHHYQFLLLLIIGMATTIPVKGSALQDTMRIYKLNGQIDLPIEKVDSVKFSPLNKVSVYKDGNITYQTSRDSVISIDFKEYQSPLITASVGSVTSYSAKVNTNVNYSGSLPCAEYGIVYGKSKMPTLETGTKIIADTNVFVSHVLPKNSSITLDGLIAKTKYYVRPYVKNTKETFYGAQVEVNTSISTTSKNVLLQGMVKDEEGNVLDSVKISSNGGTKYAINDNSFAVFSQNVPVTNISYDNNTVAPEMQNGLVVLTIERNGYYTVNKSIPYGDTMSIIAILEKKQAEIAFDASTGTQATDGNFEVTIPANSLVYKGTTTPYSGSAKVSVQYLNPEDSTIFDKLPGNNNLLAVSSNDESGRLIPFGMADVVITSNTGAALQISDAAVSQISMIIPDSALASAPDTIPLWYYDETTGLWKEEGIALRNGDKYEGSVTHFTWWTMGWFYWRFNPARDEDIKYANVSFDVNFVYADGTPVTNFMYEIEDDYRGPYWSYSWFGRSTGSIWTCFNEAQPYNSRYGRSVRYDLLTDDTARTIGICLYPQDNASKRQCTTLTVNYSDVVPNVDPRFSGTMHISLGTIQLDYSAEEVSGLVTDCNGKPMRLMPMYFRKSNMVVITDEYGRYNAKLSQSNEFVRFPSGYVDETPINAPIIHDYIVPCGIFPNSTYFLYRVNGETTLCKMTAAFNYLTWSPGFQTAYPITIEGYDKNNHYTQVSVDLDQSTLKLNNWSIYEIGSGGWYGGFDYADPTSLEITSIGSATLFNGTYNNVNIKDKTNHDYVLSYDNEVKFIDVDIDVYFDQAITGYVTWNPNLSSRRNQNQNIMRVLTKDDNNTVYDIASLDRIELSKNDSLNIHTRYYSTTRFNLDSVKCLVFIPEATENTIEVIRDTVRIYADTMFIRDTVTVYTVVHDTVFVYVSTGMENARIAEIIKVHPNPVVNEMLVDFDYWEPGDKIEMYNTSGIKQKSVRIESERTKVNISNLPSGIYYVKIRDNAIRIVKI